MRLDHTQDTDLDSRILLLHNPEILTLSAHPYYLSDLLYLLGKADSSTEVLPSELLAWMDLGVQADGPPADVGEVLAAENPITPWLRQGAVGQDAHDAFKYWERARALIAKFQLKPGEAGLVINGRVRGRPSNEGNR